MPPQDLPPQAPRQVNLVLLSVIEYEVGSNPPEIAYFEWTVDGKAYRTRPGEIAFVAALEEGYVSSRPVYADGKDYGNGSRCIPDQSVAMLATWNVPDSSVIYAIMDYEWSEGGQPVYCLAGWRPWNEKTASHGWWMIQNRPLRPEGVADK